MEISPNVDRWGFQRFVESSVSEGFLREPVLMEGMSGSRITRNGLPYVNFFGDQLPRLATGPASARCVL